MHRLHLQLLDDVRAGTADAPAASSLQQPRKLAVLAYLALEQRAVPRAELAALLWGENPDETARRSLRQILHAIRLDCGFDPFIADRNFVRLDTRCVTCDVVQFYHALEQQQPAGRVVSQYDAAFMRGFAVADAREFDDWCELQRKRFDTALAEAALDASKECANARDALAYLDIVARVHPWEESILRRRMQCLQKLGECNAALALYDMYRARLREEFGRSPQADTLGLAAELRTQAAAAAENPAPAIASVMDRPASRLRPLHRLVRRHAGALAGAAMLAASIWFGINIVDWAAASDDLPVVSVRTTVSGADPAHSNDVTHQVTAYLADTAYALSATSARAADAFVSVALDVSDGVRGTATVSRDGGTILATLPLVYTSKSEPEAIADLARKLRREISVVLAPDRESANAARLHYRLDDALEAVKNGGVTTARNSLESIDNDVNTMRLDRHVRELLRSRWWEIQASLMMAQTRDRTRTVELLRKAIGALKDTSSYDNAARQRLVKLHYNVHVYSTHDSTEHLERLVQQAERVPPRRRAPDTWVKLAQAHFYLGAYADAHAVGAAARTAQPTLATRDELDIVMFESALASGHTATAHRECERMRTRKPDRWPAVSCAALAMGWADADYTPRQLLAETAAIVDPQPSSAHFQHQLVTLIAAASARRRHDALADSLLRNTPVGSDNGALLFRAVALKELGRPDDARPFLDQLESTSAGRRTMRTSAWLLAR